MGPRPGLPPALKAKPRATYGARRLRALLLNGLSALARGRRAAAFLIFSLVMGESGASCAPPGCHIPYNPPYVVVVDGGIPAGLFAPDGAIDGGGLLDGGGWTDPTISFCMLVCGNGFEFCAPQPDAGSNAIACPPGGKTGTPPARTVFVDGGIPRCLFNPPADCSAPTWCPTVCTRSPVSPATETCHPVPDLGPNAIECDPEQLHCL